MINNVCITVEPECSLIDERLNIQVKGLKPCDRIKIKAFSPDYYKIVKKRVTQGNRMKEVEWASYGVFVADGEGKVDLSTQKPIEGTYNSADSMGLFWSMKSEKKVEYKLSRKLEEIPVMKSMKVIFTVEINNKEIASCECKRLFTKEDVNISDVTSNGLVARFFNIPGSKPRPGVIVLGGSDGSIYNSQKIAGVLASHGYAALALAYYGMDTLPGSLENLPVEYVEKAVQWMKDNKEVDCEHLTVFGKSKGAELALLSGSYINDIHGVMGWIPSPIAFEGLNTKGRSGGFGSWSYKNKPVPFIKFKVNSFTFGFKCFLNILRRKPIPIQTEELYTHAIQNQEEVKKGFFPIEKTNGPILLVSSTLDNIWPSKELSEMAIERLKVSKFSYKYKHLNYQAGHFIFIPYEPITRCDASPEEVAYADKNSWSNILLFLEENCKEHSCDELIA
jgi:uncharacterized protein